MHTQAINGLERKFLETIEYGLYVDKQTYSIFESWIFEDWLTIKKESINKTEKATASTKTSMDGDLSRTLSSQFNEKT